MTFHFVSAQTCPDIDNNFAVNVDNIFFVKNCILHPVTDIKIYNEMLATANFNTIELSNEQYMKLSIGDPYVPEMPAEQLSNLCTTYEKHVVSSDNISFYYVENCKKRKFLSYNDVEVFGNSVNFGAIQSISSFELKHLKSDRVMTVTPLPWPEPKTALQIIKSIPRQKITCAQVQKKAPTPFVAHYGSVFYLENCILHKITNVTIELMKQADDAGGIYELSTQEVLGLPRGEQWNSKKK